MIAGGLALPEHQAQAQGSHAGYTYSQRICQEYGQQPRHYNVRDEIAGSDWSSSGGWAIVLVTSSAIRTRFGSPTLIGGARQGYLELTSPQREQTQFTDSSSGLTGFALYYVDGRSIGSVVIDRNNDGRIDIAGDRTAGPASNQWEYRTYTTEMYGARYIRWANMQWCR